MKTLKSVMSICIGTFLVSLAINVFFVYHNLVFGGVSGLAIFLQSVAGLPISITNIAVNIPLFLLGAKLNGKGFLLKSIFATTMLSLFVELTSSIPPIASDLVVASIFGGIILGIGVGIVLNAGGSTGGTDMLASILNKRFSIPMPAVIFLTDAAIILLGVTVFGINNALYAIITVFCISKTVGETIKRLTSLERKAQPPPPTAPAPVT